MSKVLEVKGQIWPWRVDKKKPQDEQPVLTRKPQAVTLVTRKRKEPETGKRKLVPITQMVRNKNGQVNKAKVKNMIHSLEKMVQ